VTPSPPPLICAVCGDMSARVYVTSDDVTWCSRCSMSSKWNAEQALIPRCHFCREVLDASTAEFIKSRKAYYCSETQCKKEEQKCKRLSKDPRTKTSSKKTPSSPVSCQRPKSKPLNSSISSTRPNAGMTAISPSSCVSGTAASAPSGASPALPKPTSSRSLPGTSKTAGFDQEAVSELLRGNGLDLDGWMDQPDEDGRYYVMTCGRVARKPVGWRWVKLTSKGWKLEKNEKKIKGGEYDPLSGGTYNDDVA
jgi:hypothetical protein